jgi:hypothetical protein
MDCSGKEWDMAKDFSNSIKGKEYNIFITYVIYKLWLKINHRLSVV